MTVTAMMAIDVVPIDNAAVAAAAAHGDSDNDTGDDDGGRGGGVGVDKGGGGNQAGDAAPMEVIVTNGDGD